MKSEYGNLKGKRIKPTGISNKMTTCYILESCSHLENKKKLINVKIQTCKIPWSLHNSLKYTAATVWKISSTISKLWVEIKNSGAWKWSVFNWKLVLHFITKSVKFNKLITTQIIIIGD